jgi:hypothetical protein
LDFKALKLGLDLGTDWDEKKDRMSEMRIEYNTTQETQETLGNDLSGPGQPNEKPQAAPLIIQPITSSQIYTKDMVDQR